MLTYTLEDIHRENPYGTRAKRLYEQLYEKIRNDILEGTIASKSKLPSKRELARQLAVSVITVETAYAKLVDEGYVYTLPKSGFFVADINVDEHLKKFSVPTKNTLQKDLPQSEPYTHNTHSANSISLSESRMEQSLFPFTTWSRLVRRVLSEQRAESMQPSPANGIAELREAIAQHLYGFRGLYVHPEQIVVGAGTEYLYSLILQLLGFENTFAIEDPGYAKIARVYEVCNVRCIPVQLDEQGINMESLLASGANIAHISPSHHFPTGRTTTISRRYELLSWASTKDNRYIIEDDYDAEFRLNGRTIPTLRSIDTIDRVIYLNTFTKTLSPALRISYMVLPLPLLERFKKKLGFYANTVPTMHQHTLALFMKEGHFESHISRVRRHYRECRDAALAELKNFSELSAATVLEADAGVYFLLRLQTQKSDASLKLAAAEEELELSFLSDFFANPPKESETSDTHTIIVDYASLSEERLKEAFARLERILER